MSFNNIRSKYMKDLTDINAPTTNILDQLPSYNSYDTKVFIDTLTVEYDEQKLLNRMLTDEDVSGQSNNVKNFVDKNSDKIQKELLSISEISTKLKTICQENKQLESEKTEFQELINSHECNEVAENLRKIKLMKQEILHFLDNECQIHIKEPNYKEKFLDDCIEFSQLFFINEHEDTDVVEDIIEYLSLIHI